MNGNDGYFLRNALAVCIHTLVEVGAFHDLFADLKQMAGELKLRDAFYEELEPYLLLGKIKWAPTKEIRKICEFYSKKDKMSVLKNFLMNLSVDAVDYNLLVATCVENRLHIPLIYICTQSAYEDYLMPAIKMYKEFSDSKLVFDQINEMTFGHYCLWYMRMILNGQCLGEPIKQAQLPSIVASVDRGLAVGRVLLHGADSSPDAQFRQQAYALSLQAVLLDAQRGLHQPEGLPRHDCDQRREAKPGLDDADAQVSPLLVDPQGDKVQPGGSAQHPVLLRV